MPLLWLGIANAVGLAHSLILYRQGLINIGQVVAFNGLLLLFGFPTFSRHSPIRRSLPACRARAASWR